MVPPTFSSVSHISFSVRDADASAAWWRRLFGFVELDTVAGVGWRGILMLHVASATVLEVQQHDGNGGEPFDPRRTGFDHMGFKVDDETELLRWEECFQREGIVHTPVVKRDYGSVLTFKDPDGIQFEMFYRGDHP